MWNIKYSFNHQVTSTVEYVVVLFTGPCDEAARNTECEVLHLLLLFSQIISTNLRSCLPFLLKPSFYPFETFTFLVNFQEIIEELETIDDEVDSYGMALVTTEVKCHNSSQCKCFWSCPGSNLISHLEKVIPHISITIVSRRISVIWSCKAPWFQPISKICIHISDHRGIQYINIDILCPGYHLCWIQTQH